MSIFFLFLGDNNCQLWVVMVSESSWRDIMCIILSSMSVPLQLWLQRDAQLIRLHSFSLWQQHILSSLHLLCLLFPHMHETSWGAQTMQPVLIRLLYADCMSEWESICAECEHYLQGEYKIRPCVVNGASVNVDQAGMLLLWMWLPSGSLLIVVFTKKTLVSSAFLISIQH